MFKIKKLNNKGVAHHVLLPVLAISLLAGAGAYVISKSSAAATGASITIRPQDWQYIVKGEIVDDGSRGEVLKLRKPQADSSRPLAQTSSNATEEYPTGVPLAKVVNFTKNNLGKTARICVVAKAEYNNYAPEVGLTINNTTDPNGFKGKSFILTKNYERHCFNYKIVSTYDELVPTNSDVQNNGTYNSGQVFIDKVEISIP